MNRQELEFLTTNKDGKRKVKIQNDGYDLQLLTMRNGFQWTGQPVDDELLDMIIECINQYKNDPYNSPSDTGESDEC